MAKKKELNLPANFQVAVDLGLVDKDGRINLERTRDRLLGEIAIRIGSGDIKQALWGEVLLIFEMGVGRGLINASKEE